MSIPVTVNILGKEYQVACPEEEKAALLESARLVHQNMDQIPKDPLWPHNPLHNC